MKAIILVVAILFSCPSHAKICSVIAKTSGSKVYSYEAPVCAASQLGGPYSNPNDFNHAEDTAASQAKDALDTADKQAKTDRQALRDQLKALHAKNKAGTITPQERLDLARLLTELVLNSAP